MNNKQTLQTFIRYEFIETLIEGLFMICRLDKSYWMPDTVLRHSYETHGSFFMPDTTGFNKAIGYFNNCYMSQKFELESYNLVYLTDGERKNPMKVIFQLWETYNLRMCGMHFIGGLWSVWIIPVLMIVGVMTI